MRSLVAAQVDRHSATFVETWMRHRVFRVRLLTPAKRDARPSARRRVISAVMESFVQWRS